MLTVLALGMPPAAFPAASRGQNYVFATIDVPGKSTYVAGINDLGQIVVARDCTPQIALRRTCRWKSLGERDLPTRDEYHTLASGPLESPKRSRFVTPSVWAMRRYRSVNGLPPWFT
jgi:hypothetical protein